MIWLAWFDHLEESFSYKEVQLKTFAQLWKSVTVLMKTAMKPRELTSCSSFFSQNSAGIMRQEGLEMGSKFPILRPLVQNFKIMFQRICKSSGRACKNQCTCSSHLITPHYQMKLLHDHTNKLLNGWFFLPDHRLDLDFPTKVKQYSTVNMSRMQGCG